jgi:hypothetical protein
MPALVAIILSLVAPPVFPCTLALLPLIDSNAGAIDPGTARTVYAYVAAVMSVAAVS